MDDPVNIFFNYIKINISRSVLVTDYIALAGIGAALLNAAISGFLYLALLIGTKTPPTGRLFAALFVTIGFSFFGKNIFNTIPLMLGIKVYAKVNGKKFSDLFAASMFSGTIAPIVSEIAFLDDKFNPLHLAAAYAVGIFIGFIFPIVAEAAKSMHKGFCLYNGGIAGGFISTFVVGFIRSFGVEILPEKYWDTSHTVPLVAFVYVMAAAMILFGIITNKPTAPFYKFKQFLNEKDIRDKDYLIEYGTACYINIGVMCAAVTTLVLILKFPINGPTLGAILTVTGFTAIGKSLKNSFPILIGSIVSAYINHLELFDSANILAIIFSTGLAPICGKYGWFCGFIVGFLHVTVAIFIGNLNGGMNLYNNGFAEGFVAITAVPLIVFAKELWEKMRNAQKPE